MVNVEDMAALTRRALLGTTALLPLAAGSRAAGSSGDVARATRAARTGPATVARGLRVPWGIAFTSAGTALVGERDTGRILEIGPRGVHTVGEIAVHSLLGEGGETGLLGLALWGGSLFAYHSTAQDNRVVRMSWDGSRLGTPVPILTGIETSLHHNGGALRFGLDGSLFVATGDAETPEHAQDKESLNGKVLRITRTGGVPLNNPWRNPVWSRGHRNVEGLALDAQGRLWATEFGEKRYDELNHILRGRDYGWPLVEGRDGPGGAHDPFVQWGPTSTCSPSGLAIAHGKAWVGALRGECVFSVDLRTRARRRHLLGHGRIRMVAHAPDGSLWVGTSNRDGRGSVRAGDDRIFRL